MRDKAGTVPKNSSDIVVSPNRLTMLVGESTDLSATVLPVNATYSNLIWSSSDTSVVSVSTNGKVTTIGSGITTVLRDMRNSCILTEDPSSFGNGLPQLQKLAEISPESITIVIDFVDRDIHSFLRNETIARVLYLCKDVETFGSGIRKFYSLCNAEGINIRYENSDMAFSVSFAREDRNKLYFSGHTDGRINDRISDLEQSVLTLLRNDPRLTYVDLIAGTGKSQRTISRVLDSLKGKGLIVRVGSNKTGYWQVK